MRTGAAKASLRGGKLRARPLDRMPLNGIFGSWSVVHCNDKLLFCDESVNDAPVGGWRLVGAGSVRSL